MSQFGYGISVPSIDDILRRAKPLSIDDILARTYGRRPTPQISQEELARQLQQSVQAMPAEGPGEDERSSLDTALAALDLPRNLVANAIAAVSGTESSSKRLGLFGLPEITGSDFLNDLGVENPWVRGGAGFLTDIAIDPTTYLFGLGAAKAAGVGGAKRGVGFGGELLKGTQSVFQPTAKTIQTLGEAAAPALRLKDIAERSLQRGTTKLAAAAEKKLAQTGGQRAIDALEAAQRSATSEGLTSFLEWPGGAAKGLARSIRFLGETALTHPKSTAGKAIFTPLGLGLRGIGQIAEGAGEVVRRAGLLYGAPLRALGSVLPNVEIPGTAAAIGAISKPIAAAIEKSPSIKQAVETSGALFNAARKAWEQTFSTAPRTKTEAIRQETAKGMLAGRGVHTQFILKTDARVDDILSEINAELANKDKLMKDTLLTAFFAGHEREKMVGRYGMESVTWDYLSNIKDIKEKPIAAERLRRALFPDIDAERALIAAGGPQAPLRAHRPMQDAVVMVKPDGSRTTVFDAAAADAAEKAGYIWAGSKDGRDILKVRLAKDPNDVFNAFRTGKLFRGQVWSSPIDGLNVPLGQRAVESAVDTTKMVQLDSAGNEMQNILVEFKNPLVLTQQRLKAGKSLDAEIAKLAKKGKHDAVLDTGTGKVYDFRENIPEQPLEQITAKGAGWVIDIALGKHDDPRQLFAGRKVFRSKQAAQQFVEENGYFTEKTVRLYRPEHASRTPGKSDPLSKWTDDLNYANEKIEAAGLQRGRIMFVDVPESQAEQFRRSNLEKDVDTGAAATIYHDKEFLLPDSFAAKAQQVTDESLAQPAKYATMSQEYVPYMIWDKDPLKPGEIAFRPLDPTNPVDNVMEAMIEHTNWREAQERATVGFKELREGYGAYKGRYREDDISAYSSMVAGDPTTAWGKAGHSVMMQARAWAEKIAENPLRKAGGGIKRPSQIPRIQEMLELPTVLASQTLDEMNVLLQMTKPQFDIAIKSATPEAQNVIKKWGMLPGDGPIPNFITDPIKSQMLRGNEMIETVGSWRFGEQVFKEGKEGGWIIPAEAGAVPNRPPEAGMKLVESHMLGNKHVAAAIGGPVWMPKEEADSLVNAAKLWKEPGLFVRAFDKLTSWWKTGALMTFGYHNRNIMTGIGTGMLGDGFSDYAWKTMQEGLMNFMRARGNLADKALNKIVVGTSKSADATRILGSKRDFRITDLVKIAQDDGLIGRTLYQEAGSADDFAAMLSRATDYGMAERKGYHQFRFPADLSRALGSFNEDAQKLGFLAERLRRGDTVAQATTRVRKFQFDYTSLTDTEKKIFRRVAPFYCVPTEAEALTRRGWKRYDELRSGELVMSYNVEKDELEWVPLEGVAVFDFDGELEHFASKRGIDLACTAEHKWAVLRNRTFVKGKWYGGDRILKAAESLSLNDKIMMSAQYRGGGTKGSLKPEEARLLGWLLTDGYFRNRTGSDAWEAIIYQHPKKFLNEVVLVAGGRPRKPHPDTDVVAVPVTQDRIRRLKPYLALGKDGADTIPASLSREAAEAMYDAMYKADGSTAKMRDRRGHKHLAAECKGVRECFRILCVLLGKRTKAGSRGCYISDKRGVKMTTLKVRKILYRGQVWCPQTRNKTWVMRYRDTITITGNSWIRKNTALMAQTVMERPSALALLPKMRNELESSFMGDMALPPSMRPKMAEAEQMVQTQGGMKPEFFSPLGYLPTKELGLVLGGTETPRALARTAIESINPLLKALVEAALNYDTFFDRPIAAYPGEQETFFGLGVPPKGEYLARQLIPPLQQARRMFDPDIDVGVRAGRAAGFRTWGGNLAREVGNESEQLYRQRYSVKRDIMNAMNNNNQDEADRLLDIYRQLDEQVKSLPTTILNRMMRPAKKERDEEFSGYLGLN